MNELDNMTYSQVIEYLGYVKEDSDNEVEEASQKDFDNF